MAKSPLKLLSRPIPNYPKIAPGQVWEIIRPLLPKQSTQSQHWAVGTKFLIQKFWGQSYDTVIVAFFDGERCSRAPHYIHSHYRLAKE